MKIRQILTHVKNFFDTETRQKREDEAFLAEAIDVIDLERRLKILENKNRGERLC